MAAVGALLALIINLLPLGSYLHDQIEQGEFTGSIAATFYIMFLITAPIAIYAFILEVTTNRSSNIIRRPGIKHDLRADEYSRH